MTDTPRNSTGLGGVALWVAVSALAVWMIFSIVLLVNIGRIETEWTRIAWVFGSIQSVAFAAAGALFGTAVQQHSVNTSRREAADAKADADQQRDVAGKGRAFAAMVQAEGAVPGTVGQEGLERMGAGRSTEPESADTVRRRHAQLSHSLFGDLL